MKICRNTHIKVDIYTHNVHIWLKCVSYCKLVVIKKNYTNGIKV